MFLDQILKEPRRQFLLVNGRTGQIVAEHLATAFDSASRNKGLLGRDSFEAGNALIIAPGNAIHTWFMRFPIDVAYVRKNGQIIKIKNSLGPWRLSAALGAFAVIELPAGALQASGTQKGDELALRPA